MITVVRLAGPLLAWPAPSQYRSRQTAAAPTLSAIQGLLAAAAGITRDQPRPTWISEAPIAVRVDRPGSALRDYHTINPADRARYRRLSSRDLPKVRTVANADGSPHKSPVVTERYYRQDQTVLVFIDDPDADALRALRTPRFAIYAGRKACVLSFPFVLGQMSCSLELALATVPSVTPVSGPVPASDIAKLEGVLFAPPQELAKYKEPVSRPERPAGRVGEQYLMQKRHSVLVDPPLLESWWDVVDALITRKKGDDHVAV